MEAATELGAGAERIESEWLREFGDRYQAAWSAYDPDAVAVCGPATVPMM